MSPAGSRVQRISSTQLASCLEEQVNFQAEPIWRRENIGACAFQPPEITLKLPVDLHRPHHRAYPSTHTREVSTFSPTLNFNVTVRNCSDSAKGSPLVVVTGSISALRHSLATTIPVCPAACILEKSVLSVSIADADSASTKVTGLCAEGTIRTSSTSASMMAHPRGGGSDSAALAVLDYMHAPIVGCYYAGAAVFGAIVLQKPKLLPSKRRRIGAALIAAIVVSYISEVVYNVSRSFAEEDYDPVQHAVVQCLGSILVWTPLGISLAGSDSTVWHPWVGAFILEFIFNTSLCLLRGVALDPRDRYNSVPLGFSSFRALAALILLVNGFFISLSTKTEKGTDEEGQSLLGEEANSTPKVNGTANGLAGYGAIEPTPEDEDEDEEKDDDDKKEIKESQAKRLAEKGGWIGYLKGFAVFLPVLFPIHDKKVMFCFFIRFINLILSRALNVLVPRQLGIITNKLAAGTRVMPWKDISLWAFFKWLDTSSGFGLLDSLANNYIDEALREKLTMLAFTHVMALSMDFHTNKQSGEVIKAIDQATSLQSMVELIIFELSPILVDFAVAIWYITHLFDIYMAFIVIFMGASYIWWNLVTTLWMQKRYRKYLKTDREENTVLYESIPNWQTISYFNRTTYEVDRYRKSIWGAINAYLSYMYGWVKIHAIGDFVLSSTFVICCIFAIWRIVQGRAPLGNLITFMMYWSTIVSPLYIVGMSYKRITNKLIDAERLLQLLETKPSVQDPEHAQSLDLTSCKVEFKDVDFAYDERKPVLADVNFVAESGQTVAFVGETGGGKSTMLKLLMRHYDVTGGSIMINGQDLRSVKQEDLRDALGMVPQDPVLFNRSIRENVRYARLDATNAEIEEACKQAAIHDTIVSFPDGYKSKVGERGVKLSGGQLQRIAIARVLLKNPHIVLLDEATSAIDSATETQIQEAFKKLSAGRTTFVIAHRLSTIAEADLIIVVDQGKILERGTHWELLQKGGKYSELWTKQTAGHLSHANSKAPSTHGDEILIDITPADDDVKDNVAGEGSSKS
ncbi:hypothetical protein P154DRAFT_621694 [Amniculicola lignicola CBS 123094]|uniref:ATP-binding cassette-type vacuolar membrane transporter-like protein Hmt1 n=1 Tax=Amniculicola lignicola CBS 123094 TaxID=1392246 RepID=A0A6A5WCC9_9PLEO|nr:hypothetical protein P154DRAFT_621694 [Amniculicola lignicola CBS 123094]